MSSQTSEAALKQVLGNLIEAAHRINATASRIAQLTSTPSASMSKLGDTLDVATSLEAAAIALTPGQRLVCERVINVFETGTVTGKYGAISIFADGPHDIRQITYGRSQTTEYGNLRELVQMYVDAGGLFSEDLREFVPLIGRTALVDNARFKDLLRRAGVEDPVMRQTQDVFFDRRYFTPALRWADQNGFMRALSALVIYDSFIHSGSIRDFLRARFAEKPPARGGNEQVWIREYVDVRHQWLLGHHRPAVRASAYRTRDLAREIARGNWDLSLLPIMANGVPVDDRDLDGGTGVADEIIPFLGDLEISGDDAYDAGGEIWGDDEAAFAVPAADVAAADPAALATRILANPKISLATGHVSGVRDQANARQNISDTAAGGLARRSSYGNAPGGTVALDRRLLQGLLALADQFSFSVSEIAGGSHNPNSRHYVGVAADINVFNGRHVGANHPDLAAFKTACRNLGVTELRGPGDPHHATHIHAAWPRPS
jgi:chitosanase